MKKLLSLLPFLCACFVSAQVDTFTLRTLPKDYYLGEHWPQFNTGRDYYHEDGTHCILDIDANTYQCDGSRFHSLYYNKPPIGLGANLSTFQNFAAGKHVDNPISIAGIAFVYIYKDRNLCENLSYQSVCLSSGYDILRLQVLDTSMHVLAGGSVMMSDSVKKVLYSPGEAYDEWNITGCVYVYDILEAFFDAPVTVSDSFYLASHFECSDPSMAKDNYGVSPVTLYETHMTLGITTDYDYPKFTWRTLGGHYYEYDSTLQAPVQVIVPESVWHDDDGCEVNHGFMLIFPILEVVCDVPQGVSASPMGSGHVLLRWDTGQWDTAWEVSYGPSGTLPGQGTVLATNEPSLMLSGISPDTTYVAYVRSLCTVRDTQWSDWSDSINFGRRQSIGAVAGNVTVDLLPNPAAERLLLTADAELSAIDVYTSAGTHHTRLPATGRAAHIDVSAWPAGTYLLLVHTDRGALLRRLTVAR